MVCRALKNYKGSKLDRKPLRRRVRTLKSARFLSIVVVDLSKRAKMMTEIFSREKEEALQSVHERSLSPARFRHFSSSIFSLRAAAAAAANVLFGGGMMRSVSFLIPRRILPPFRSGP